MQTLRHIVLPQACGHRPTDGRDDLDAQDDFAGHPNPVDHGLFFQASASATVWPFPMAVMASIWLGLTSILMVGQYYLERNYAKGHAQPAADTHPEGQAQTRLGGRGMSTPNVNPGPKVLAENVHKSFGRNEVLRGINLSIDAGQVACIIGPSGGGKSTFLRCINHLEKIDSGKLSVDGELIDTASGAASCMR
jgi:ABC-type multidrug transport system fused ATPase/permease subunit